MQKLIDALNVIKEECERHERHEGMSCDTCPMYILFHDNCVFNISSPCDMAIIEEPPVIRVVE